MRQASVVQSATADRCTLMMWAALGLVLAVAAAEIGLWHGVRRSLAASSAVCYGWERDARQRVCSRLMASSVSPTTVAHASSPDTASSLTRASVRSATATE